MTIPNTSQSSSDIGVKHYKTGRDSWKVGFWHYWLRYRGLLTALALPVLTGGLPWWWPTHSELFEFPQTITVPLGQLSIALACTCALILFGVFLYARRRAQRSLTCKDKLHTMSHTMRDAYCELLARTGARMSKHDLAHEKQHIFTTSNAIAQSVVDYYQVLTGTTCVGAVIRLVEDIPGDGKDQSHYVAVGRAGSTDNTRAQSSEPIMSHEGIPKVFKDAKDGASGVLFFDNLEKAKRHQIYKETENERTFPGDYDCVIAVPLNGFDGQKKNLIGILTITGRSKRKMLRVQHVDLLKAIGDRLAEHYSATIARLSATKRLPDLYRELGGNQKRNQ